MFYIMLRSNVLQMAALAELLFAHFNLDEESNAVAIFDSAWKSLGYDNGLSPEIKDFLEGVALSSPQEIGTDAVSRLTSVSQEASEPFTIAIPIGFSELALIST